MKTIGEILRDADPLRRESGRLEGECDRLRRTVVAAASGAGAPSFERVRGLRRHVNLLAAVALMVVAGVAVGSRLWSPGGATLAAAIGFEVRLAEDQPAPGLREARVAGSDRVVYLHPDVVVTNTDIAQSRVVEGDGPSRFSISVQFTTAGGQKMQQATAGHIGRPLAILIDGDVVIAPVLRDPIGTSAVITGDYTRAEAERVVNGISMP